MDKFILLSTARAGSTNIGVSLLKHPEVLYYNELFHAYIKTRKKESSRMECGGIRLEVVNGPRYSFKHCTMTDSGYEYLSEFYSQDVPFKIIGFKLLTSQTLMVRSKNTDLWNYIADHSEIKIIYVHRGNMLEKVCSHARAANLGYWHTNKQEEIEPFVLSVKDCKRIFKLMEIKHPVVRKIQETHRVLNLEYDQIYQDFQKTMKHIYEFLEIRSDIKTQSILSKIANIPPHEEIINYQELKEYFKDTQYGKYFKY